VREAAPLTGNVREQQAEARGPKRRGRTARGMASGTVNRGPAPEQRCQRPTTTAATGRRSSAPSAARAPTEGRRSAASAPSVRRSTSDGDDIERTERFRRRSPTRCSRPTTSGPSASATAPARDAPRTARSPTRCSRPTTSASCRSPRASASRAAARVAGAAAAVASPIRCRRRWATSGPTPSCASSRARRRRRRPGGGGKRGGGGGGRRGGGRREPTRDAPTHAHARIRV
jgi:hypothetical protein